MFKNSTSKQIDMFQSIVTQLSPSKVKLLESKNSWHMTFYNDLVSQIDERPYSVLYHSSIGRPNSSIRTMIGMMILKEGQGWSDEQLFEECRFNIKAMLALGLINLTDDVPVESSYYEFRRLLVEHKETCKVDLLKDTFSQITKKQVHKYGVSGKKIRMDSKLINSNIAKSTRIYLIIEGLRKYIKEEDLAIYKTQLDDYSYDLLEQLKVKSTSNITYPLNTRETKDLLVKLGSILQILLTSSAGIGSKYYLLLKRIYEEQYEELAVKATEKKENDNTPEEKGKKEEEKKGVEISPKSPKEIPSNSVQSVHDPEAAYRKKGHGHSQQTITGYHGNVTESCEPSDCVNLIVDVEVVAANISEDEFLLPSVGSSQAVIGEEEAEKIEEVITDGGYDSVVNRKEMLSEDQPQWSVAKMKGGKHRFTMYFE